MTAAGIPFSSPSQSLALYLHLSLASLFKSHCLTIINRCNCCATQPTRVVLAHAAQQGARVAMVLVEAFKQ